MLVDAICVKLYTFRRVAIAWLRAQKGAGRMRALAGLRLHDGSEHDRHGRSNCRSLGVSGIKTGYQVRRCAKRSVRTVRSFDRVRTARNGAPLRHPTADSI